MWVIRPLLPLGDRLVKSTKAGGHWTEQCPRRMPAGCHLVTSLLLTAPLLLFVKEKTSGTFYLARKHLRLRKWGWVRPKRRAICPQTAEAQVP
jgi:hypothetical protein